MRPTRQRIVPSAEERRIAAPKPQLNVAHAQPYAVEQQHHGHEGFGREQAVLIAQGDISKAHQEEIGETSQPRIEQDVPKVLSAVRLHNSKNQLYS